jgi:long-chain acyl-CoA synthetase
MDMADALQAAGVTGATSVTTSTNETRDIAAERAAIDGAVAGKTIPSVLHETAERYPEATALKWRTPGGWQTLTWADYRAVVRDATLGLQQLGFGRGEFGLIMARNRPEHLIADLALVHAGGAAVSLYNTLAPEQIAYITNHCEATIAFLEDRTFLEKFLAIRDQLPRLRRIVLMEDDAGAGPMGGWVIGWQAFLALGHSAAEAAPAAFEASWRQVRPDDILALIYTSGTTGAPKGVTYTNRNILWTCESSCRLAGYELGERWISYLPLAHIAERFSSHWSGMYNVGITHLVPDPATLLPALLDVHPTAFVGVPRVWEKFQVGIRLGIAAEPDEQRRTMIQGAMAASRQLVDLEQSDQPVPPELRARVEALAPVLTAIRAKIGLDQCRFPYTSTAPTPADVLFFFASIGLPLVEVWGMSELTGPATANPLERIKLGTVGQTLPGVEAKLGPDGELMIRGGNVMPAYYKDPGRTADTFDDDGWLLTGDVATEDADGYYRIVDRKKELIITSGGKNISPANIEALLKHHPLIGQAIAVGDGRQFVTALLVLDGEVTPTWAKAHGIAATSLAELSTHPAVVEEVRMAVREANAHLAQVEQVKRITILPGEWTPESEELTPTLKLKRRVVLTKYAREIEGMYAEAAGIEISARPDA